jgi:hypothetical protein
MPNLLQGAGEWCWRSTKKKRNDWKNVIWGITPTTFAAKPTMIHGDF